MSSRTPSEPPWTPYSPAPTSPSPGLEDLRGAGGRPVAADEGEPGRGADEAGPDRGPEPVGAKNLSDASGCKQNIIFVG